jgi:hypothetical protein
MRVLSLCHWGARRFIMRWRHHQKILKPSPMNRGEDSRIKVEFVLQDCGTDTAGAKGHGVLELGHLGKRSGEASTVVLESSRHTLGSAHRVNFLGAKADDTERLHATT